MFFHQTVLVGQWPWFLPIPHKHTLGQQLGANLVHLKMTCKAGVPIIYWKGARRCSALCIHVVSTMQINSQSLQWLFSLFTWERTTVVVRKKLHHQINARTGATFFLCGRLCMYFWPNKGSLAVHLFWAKNQIAKLWTMNTMNETKYMRRCWYVKSASILRWSNSWS